MRMLEKSQEDRVLKKGNCNLCLVYVWSTLGSHGNDGSFMFD